MNGTTGTLEKKRRFLEIYPVEGTVTHAAQKANVPRRTVYNWIERDAEFAAAFDEAREAAAGNRRDRGASVLQGRADRHGTRIQRHLAHLPVEGPSTKEVRRAGRAGAHRAERPADPDQGVGTHAGGDPGDP